MAKFDPSKRDSFGTKFGVIAAAAGSAVGLGNIWRFPYVAGENGGGAFILIYLLFIIAIGMPVMLSEFTIGRRAQRNAFGSFKRLAPNTYWYLIGLLGVVAAFVILSFYSTVAGWTLEYIYLSFSNAFAEKNPDQLTTMFETFKAGTFRPILWQLVFMVLTAWIVIAGVKKGIEKYAKILMPILLLLIIVLDIRAITLPGASEGLEFLFSPDFSKLDTNSILEALGQAFFSLSIGMGTLITYGSYINKKQNLTSTAINVSAADTIIAILAGIAIFPAVFAFGIEPNAGPDLIFRTLPNIFQQMPGGYFFSLTFFILLGVAALTSSISVLEVVVAYFVEELGILRKRATIIAAVSITVLGVMSTMSWGVMGDVRIFDFNIFELLDFTASSVFLPIGGVFIVVFLGWYLGKKHIKEEITSDGLYKAKLTNIFVLIIKFLAPIAIAMVFLHGIGLLKL
ncbi:MAG: sodium-dependent transporter [Bacteroidota bacterium]